jgi:hypothetical protein
MAAVLIGPTTKTTTTTSIDFDVEINYWQLSASFGYLRMQCAVLLFVGFKKVCGAATWEFSC